MKPLPSMTIVKSFRKLYVYNKCVPVAVGLVQAHVTVSVVVLVSRNE